MGNISWTELNKKKEEMRKSLEEELVCWVKVRHLRRALDQLSSKEDVVIVYPPNNNTPLREMFTFMGDEHNTDGKRFFMFTGTGGELINQDRAAFELSKCILCKNGKLFDYDA